MANAHAFTVIVIWKHQQENQLNLQIVYNMYTGKKQKNDGQSILMLYQMRREKRDTTLIQIHSIIHSILRMYTSNRTIAVAASSSRYKRIREQTPIQTHNHIHSHWKQTFLFSISKSSKNFSMINSTWGKHTLSVDGIRFCVSIVLLLDKND